ncbi:helix-hairpin-helix domain-containing protein [Roseicyclus persicicus]|uniref:DNA-binding protein n=1 Tax=Roseicyclus persicicus TaxID=2650661 RepID=A0A7X6GZX4_9RHOB|nr:helix-hairpin-helix domain-containing protein [Roseibacterium persicicum]NKX45436.1 DNA-binding protein [Roseibacterium persicicum]
MPASDQPPPQRIEDNARIGARLARYADLLEQQGADGFRVRAYRAAAAEIAALDRPLAEIWGTGGTEALIRLRGIGRGIAAAIAEMLTTGRWRQLDRLEGELTPERLFATVPGIGPVLAHRLADALDGDTLEELEAALRLGDAEVPGLGPRRRAAILAALAQRLARLPRARPRPGHRPEPPVDLLLEADALYRRKAEAGELRRIAPRRFNPTGEAWLPILHARRGPWHLTLLHSNTARAHELGRTRDWVVIFYHEEDEPERQCTVVTETQGPLAGLRVVRGREADCAAVHGRPAAEGDG